MLILPALLLPAALAAAAPLAAPAGAASEASAPNVAIVLTIGRVGGAPDPAEKTYRLVAQEGTPAKMLFGFRTPIPTRSTEDKGGEPGAMSYVYQNVGVTADLVTAPVGGDRLQIKGQIEISGAREGGGAGATAAGAKPPMIATFQQVLQVVLKVGEKLRVAEGPDPDGGTLYLDLKAERLK